MGSAVLVHYSHTVIALSQSDVALDDIAAISNGGDPPGPGCRAVSIVRPSTGEVYHQGTWHFDEVYPGRLASTSGFGLILGLQRSKYEHTTSYLYRVLQQTGGPTTWSSDETLQQPSFPAIAGGLAILSDNNTLVVATGGFVGQSANSHLSPFTVSRYSLSSIVRNPEGALQLGETTGAFELSSPAAVILPTSGSQVHVITEDLHVITLDSRSMTRGAEDIILPPYFGNGDPAPQDRWIGSVHASLSPTGRYLVTNRWTGSEPMNIADLALRTAHAVSLPPDLAPIGGLSFNRTAHGTGLLAVHGIHSVAVFTLTQTMQAVELARAALLDTSTQFPECCRVTNAVAWSGDGRHIIAADAVNHSDPQKRSEFSVFEFDSTSVTLQRRRHFMTCDAGAPAPAGILTANDLVFPEPITPLATEATMPTVSPTAHVEPTPTPPPPSPSPSSAVGPATPTQQGTLATVTPSPLPSPVASGTVGIMIPAVLFVPSVRRR